MPNLKKTRFTIKVMGHSREIISVSERSNGDLILFPQHALNFEHKSGDKAITQHRISVHLSRNAMSGGYLIKHTMTFADGSMRDQAQIVRNGSEFGSGYVAGRTFPSQTTKRYNLKEKARDEYIPISNANFPDLCLVQHIIVHNQDRNFEEFINIGFSRFTFEFTNFKITLLNAFFPICALPGSDWYTPMTSLPREGQSDPIYQFGDEYSPPIEMRKIVEMSSLELMSLTKNRRIAILKEVPEISEIFSKIELSLFPRTDLLWYPLDFIEQYSDNIPILPAEKLT